MRITKTNDRAVVLFDAVVSGDSLSGFEGRESDRRIAISLAEVGKIEKLGLHRSLIYFRNYVLVVILVGGAVISWAFR